MSTISILEQEIAEKLKQLKLLKQQEAEFNALDPEYRLAIQLHKVLCTWDHTSGCGWYYEINNGIHDWNKHAHNYWLTKSNQLLIELDNLDINIDRFLKILTLLENI